MWKSIARTLVKLHKTHLAFPTRELPSCQGQPRESGQMSCSPAEGERASYFMSSGQGDRETLGVPPRHAVSLSRIRFPIMGKQILLKHAVIGAIAIKGEAIWILFSLQSALDPDVNGKGIDMM
jgi:hypothetical protein